MSVIPEHYLRIEGGRPTHQAYHIHVDGRHNAWGNLWTSDQIFKYDPAARRFTMYDIPVHGAESRHISLLERNGQLHVVHSRTRWRT